jgi:biotin carboxyl carrier protein
MATYLLKLNDQEHELEVEEHGDGYRVRFAGKWYPVELERIGESARYSVLVSRKPYDVFAEERRQGYRIVLGAHLFEIETPGPGRSRRGGPDDLAATTGAGEWVLKSPMAGVIQEVRVQPGDEVEAGQAVMVIEAMKMQNDLHARRAGTVKAVYVTAGQRVDQGAPLLVLL